MLRPIYEVAGCGLFDLGRERGEERGEETGAKDPR